jgi:hypothetical protein
MTNNTDKTLEIFRSDALAHYQSGYQRVEIPLSMKPRILFATYCAMICLIILMFLLLFYSIPTYCYGTGVFYMDSSSKKIMVKAFVNNKEGIPQYREDLVVKIVTDKVKEEISGRILFASEELEYSLLNQRIFESLSTSLPSKNHGKIVTLSINDAKQIDSSDLLNSTCHVRIFTGTRKLIQLMLWE